MIEKSSIMLPIMLEHDSRTKISQCCEVSIPFPQSLVFNQNQLSVETTTDAQGDKGEVLSVLCQIIAYWPDRSLKWVKLTYQNSGQRPLHLKIDRASPETTKSLTQYSTLDTADKNAQSVGDTFSFKYAANTLDLSLKDDLLQVSTVSDHVLLSLHANDLQLRDAKDQAVQASFTQASMTKLDDLRDKAESAATIRLKGHFLETLIKFELIIEWLAPFELIKLDLQVHNTDRAVHSDGKWDLGDPGSFTFRSLNISLNTTQQAVVEHHTFIDVHNNQILTGNSFVCEQFSSGGENWQSPVHVNQNNELDIKRNGYQISVDQETRSGLRCQPVLNLKNNLAISVDKFWQNFPKSITVNGDLVTLGLFPATHYLHELQGGEKKSHTFWVSLDQNSNNLRSNQPIARSTISWDWINKCELYPFIEKEQSSQSSLQSIIELGLDEDCGFVAKREKVDEFGWRHFGELYADHETAGYHGSEIFVSHYNNQYDPIYGFLRQYLTTGNSKWFQLADELATHVRDIDIYHTVLDKSEYNGGLFWHTDHYLQAFTSSHRSYSKHQSSNAYQDHAGGGGPGGQHCYTTGLYLHYCLTGDQNSKQAVLTLTNWITNVYEGSGTCLELILAFKNRHIAGSKNHFTGQYPLDRGIANYINALLDSFALTCNRDYIDQVETIFANTIHPSEDLELRNLKDVENTWFYTVLLQALCRYLQVKEHNQELDESFYYCRDCLLNFAQWMLAHECPYLANPDILEYPNDTWTAQDMRKAQVLAAASYYSPDEKNGLMAKAQFFQTYVADKLAHSATKSYTRILVLLMQNQGTVEAYKTRQSAGHFAPRKDWPIAHYQKSSMSGGLLKVLSKRVIKMSPSAELDWLKKRLG